MNGARHASWQIGIALGFAGGVVAGGWWLAANVRAARAATRAWSRQEQAWRRRVRSAPPTLAEVEAGEAALAQARNSLARLATQLGPSAAGQPPPDPASRAEAFFQLSAFVRRSREDAARAGVELAADEHFGFAAYAHEAPPAAQVPAIGRQQRVVAELVGALVAARPRRLVAVQRTRPFAGADQPPAARTADGSAAGGGDYFVLEPELSVAQRGLVATEAFRLTFEGQTPALRRLLNDLAAGGRPLLVRSVAVEPVARTPAKRAAPPGAADPLVLVARPEEMRFTVTVEAYALAIALAPESPAPPARPDALPWPEPTAQSRGRGWIYELFGPPSLFYDSHAGMLGAGLAPDGPAEGGRRFDLELVQVRRGPYRWQLAGFTEGADGLRGIFADAESGATILAGPGDRLGDTAVTVRSLRVERPAFDPEGADISPAAAMATVADEATAGAVELTSRGPCETGAPLGLFASRRTPEFQRVLREGDSIALDGASYCVEQLALRPPHAVVARLGPGEKEPLILALTPASGRRPESAGGPGGRGANSP